MGDKWLGSLAIITVEQERSEYAQGQRVGFILIKSYPGNSNWYNLVIAWFLTSNIVVFSNIFSPILQNSEEAQVGWVNFGFIK